MNKSNRVLVVEDDAAIVRALSSFLTDEGFLCKSANGQAEALRLFEQEGVSSSSDNVIVAG